MSANKCLVTSCDSTYHPVCRTCRWGLNWYHEAYMMQPKKLKGGTCTCRYLVVTQWSWVIGPDVFRNKPWWLVRSGKLCLCYSSIYYDLIHTRYTHFLGFSLWSVACALKNAGRTIIQPLCAKKMWRSRWQPFHRVSPLITSCRRIHVGSIWALIPPFLIFLVAEKHSDQ